MSENQECSCCITPYDKSNHSCVECPSCNYRACKQCVRNYLLTTTSIPNCMNCHKTFDQEFMVINLNRTWVLRDYKAHRKKLLFEREFAKLVETMPRVANRKKIKVLEDEKHGVLDQMATLRKAMKALQDEQYRINVKINLLKNGEDPEQTKKFIMACPAEGCRGFLTSGYKCEICNLYTCSRCREIIGYKRDNPEHVCLEENVKSTELIKKETKPCPTCGIRIYKIDGCDQMWCTECKVAFSWKTGKIDKGVVHNPHFYQYHRANGTLQRNPGDNPCGRLVQWWSFRNNIRRHFEAVGAKYHVPPFTYPAFNSKDPNGNCKTYGEYMDSLGDLHRTISHIQHVCLPDSRNRAATNQDHEDIRVNYILNIISKEEMASQVYRKEAVARKETELSHIYELLFECSRDYFELMTNEALVCARDWAKTIVDNKPLEHVQHVDGVKEMVKSMTSDVVAVFEKYMTNFRKLIEYCNNRFGIISGVYSFKAPYICPRWFELKKEKRTDVKGLHTMVSSETNQVLYSKGEGGV